MSRSGMIESRHASPRTMRAMHAEGDVGREDRRMLEVSAGFELAEPRRRLYCRWSRPVTALPTSGSVVQDSRGYGHSESCDGFPAPAPITAAHRSY